MNRRDDAKKNGTPRGGMARELYLDAVGAEATGHVGYGDQLKGTVHEILYRDRRNLESLLKGGRELTRLTRSTTAPTVDLVTVNGRGRVVAREQLKDVLSPSGVRDVARRIESGRYRSARMVGTEETVEKLRGRVGKPLRSSGVSSRTTTRVADNRGVNVRNRDLLRSNLSDIGTQAGYAAAFAGAAGALQEAAGNYRELKAGRIDAGEYARRVALGGGAHAVKSGAKTGAALLLKEGVKGAARATGKTALKRVAGSNAVTVVAFGLVEQAVDTVAYARGSIDADEYKKRSAATAGSTGGALAGAAAGAAIGSAVPIVGTAVGAAVGGIVGSLGGGAALRRLFG